MIKEKQTNKIMKKAIFLAVIISIISFHVSISLASEEEQHEKQTVDERSELHLPNDLKVILNQEMNGIEDGMMKIIPAISSGNWETIVTIAKQIKHSFIMKQKLTQKQLEELHHLLPGEFVEMDHSFHSTAGKLAHAALEHDDELVNFYFYKLHSQCTKCHSKYASRRFPNFKSFKQGKEDQH